MSAHKKNAFTLLELLVVIGIISILLALGAISYSTAQKKSRDAKRKGDLKTIQNSLEQYYSVCGYNYPTPNAGIVDPIVCTTPPATNILPTVPVDPKTVTPYPCAGCTTAAYQLCATLETESSQFCVSNQQ